MVLYHSDKIVEVDQCFVLLDDVEPDQFFEFAENVLQERMRQVEEKARVEEEALEALKNKVEIKVINVNKEVSTQGEGNQQLFCWGTFISDTGGVEKCTFMN